MYFPYEFLALFVTFFKANVTETGVNCAFVWNYLQSHINTHIVLL